jgi:CheY-like chemotaxis protein
MSVVRLHQRRTCSHEGDLSRLGHDLRSPLNTVLGMTEVLADGVLSTEQRAQVEMLQRAGNRLLALVNGLLDGSLALEEAPARTRASARDLSDVRVLVVDDSVESQTLVTTYLARTGAHVTLAGTGEAALEAITHQRFDVVLLDMRLPDRSGLDVVRTIRLTEQTRGGTPLPVVAMSADVRPAAVSAAVDAGCSAHLAKPLGRRALLAALVANRGRVTTTPTPALKAKFLSHRAVEIAAARAALRRRDFDHLATVGHNLQGSGSSYGFPGLSALGQHIEAAAKACDARSMVTLLSELASAVFGATNADGAGAAMPLAKAVSQTRIKAAGHGGREGHRGR